MHKIQKKKNPKLLITITTNKGGAHFFYDYYLHKNIFEGQNHLCVRQDHLLTPHQPTELVLSQLELHSKTREGGWDEGVAEGRRRRGYNI